MKTAFDYCNLLDDQNWQDLEAKFDPEGQSRILAQLLQTFRDSGAKQYLVETAYIDRDFSAAYSAFYSTLYRQRSKFCSRVHFFSEDIESFLGDLTKEELATGLEAANDRYLGHVVIRPLSHAPVGSGIVATAAFERPGTQIDVRSDFKVHLLGAELKLTGIPVTEQDRRTGACAQSTIWTAGRHLQNRYAIPWFSITDITEAALKPAESMVSRSLPAGSEYLTDDSMVRALRTMGEHPIVYGREEDGWVEHPRRTISRYLDSGIPVIVGLQRGEGIGHAVVAVGSRLSVNPLRPSKDGAIMGDRLSEILVNDDQAGVYVPMAVERPARGAAGAAEPAGEADHARYDLDDAIFLIVPLPNKVFLKAETAETLARDKVAHVVRTRSEHLKDGGVTVPVDEWPVDPAFYATPVSNLVARTYLTLGWKYKQRLMRNLVPEQLKEEVTSMQLPRYVWVTEFSLAEDVVDLDPCNRRVRGHVLIDATGSNHEDPVLLTHVPGIIMAEVFEPDSSGPEMQTRLYVLMEDSPYHPKMRGRRDFKACEVPAVQPANDTDQIAA